MREFSYYGGGILKKKKKNPLLPCCPTNEGPNFGFREF
jgi:hypothetical protein